jgi:hypothetical protein
MDITVIGGTGEEGFGLTLGQVSDVLRTVFGGCRPTR